ncbi:MAG: hypothetical protein AAF654_08215 [Myxococcota bacterium]
MKRPLAVTFLFALSAAACSTQAPTLMKKRPMVASMQPMAPNPVVVEEEFDDSASGYLERAFHAFRLGQYADASEAFGAAISTNNLNDSGRALAYWHVYLCQAQLGMEDASAEALMSFSVVASDMLDPADTYSHEYMASRDFATRFNLEGRLARARATLSAMWVDRSIDYGRTDGQPIRVNSDEELDAFLELAPPCTDAAQRQVDRKVLATDGETTLEEITLYCDTRIEGARYVIEHAQR